MAVATTNRSRTWFGGLFAAIAVALIPWAATLGIILPSRHVARHWELAWAGFDVALAASLFATAVALLRRRSWLTPAAASTGTLLLADAWFDTITASTGSDLGVALLLAGLVELPLALLCFSFARAA